MFRVNLVLNPAMTLSEVSLNKQALNFWGKKKTKPLLTAKIQDRCCNIPTNVYRSLVLRNKYACIEACILDLKNENMYIESQWLSGSMSALIRQGSQFDPHFGFFIHKKLLQVHFWFEGHMMTRWSMMFSIIEISGIWSKKQRFLISQWWMCRTFVEAEQAKTTLIGGSVVA